MTEANNKITAENEDNRFETANNEPTTPASEPPESGERTTPDLENLLAETESLVSQHENVVQTVDEKVGELRNALKQFALWRKNRISRMKTIDEIKNPYENAEMGNPFTAEMRTQHIKLGLMTEETSSQFERMDELISRLEAVKYPTDEIKDKYETLLSARAGMLQKLRLDLECRKNEFEERRKRIRDKTLDVYNKRTGRFGQTIRTLENDEMVKTALEREDYSQESSRNIQSLATRLKIAMDNLAKAVGVESVESGLMKTLDLEDREQRMHVYNLRADVVAAVKNGSIGSAADIVPWRTKTGKKYLNLLRNLRDQAESVRDLGNEELTARMVRVLDLNDALRMVYGREFDGMSKDRNGKSIKKEKSEFWKALEEKERA